MNLSPNFTLDELVYSETAHRAHIINEPGAQELANLSDLCTVLLELAREMVGPLAVNSGYRCAELNRKIGGVPTSAHQEGRAADVVPINTSLQKAFDILRTSDLPFDQVIHEPSWIHIGMARPGAVPRRQALFAERLRDGGMAYRQVT